jgi:hypothetical protein
MVTSLFMRQRYPYLRHLVSWRRLSVICGVIHLCRSSLMGSILGSANAGHQKIQQNRFLYQHPLFRQETNYHENSIMDANLDIDSTAYSSVLPGRYPPHRLQPTDRIRYSNDRRRTQQEQQPQDRDDVDGTSTDVSKDDGDPSHEGRLRSTLLKNYDRNSYPWEKMWSTTTTLGESRASRTGMDVEFNLNFHKVHALNVAESTAHLVVWVQMRWKDPRLTWDPNQYGNFTKIWFWIENGIGGGEASEIWTPDIYLWNQEESMDRTLADSKSKYFQWLLWSLIVLY